MVYLSLAAPMLTGFGEFSNCSSLCGVGTQTREQFCVDSNGNMATGCVGDLTESVCCVGSSDCPSNPFDMCQVMFS